MGFSKEPALWISLIGAVITLAVTFGLAVTSEQKAAIDAIVVVLVGILTRSQVSPAK